MPCATRNSARAGGSAPAFLARNSPMTWSSWPRSMRLLRRRSQTNHSQAPRSVVIIVGGVLLKGGEARTSTPALRSHHTRVGQRLANTTKGKVGRDGELLAWAIQLQSKDGIRTNDCQTG